LAGYLLLQCPDIRVLASSREALGIEIEASLRVPSLSLPLADKPTVESMCQSEAVRLFLDRAAVALPGFALTESNAEAVARVCRRLDGIALAIELAASRVKLLRVE
jgi:predicted ATPase